MDFRPLTETERKHLVTALRGNAQDGLAVLMDRQTTSFAGTAEEYRVNPRHRPGAH